MKKRSFRMRNIFIDADTLRILPLLRMKHIVFIMLFCFVVTIKVCSQTPDASTNPLPPAAITSGPIYPLSALDDMKAFLQKEKFTTPASMLPIKGDILISGEKSSAFAKDIFLILDVRGSFVKISSVRCIWLASFSKTTDGKSAGQSSAEWRQLICDLVRGDTNRLNDWIANCNMLWASEPTGETVAKSTVINGFKYEFAGSMKTGEMDVTITPIIH